MVSERFSYGFRTVFLWFSYGFPMVFLWFPMVFLWFSYGFLWFSNWGTTELSDLSIHRVFLPGPGRNLRDLGALRRRLGLRAAPSPMETAAEKHPAEENLWKTYGKTYGKPMGKPMENLWKTMGKPMENHGKTRDLRSFDGVFFGKKIRGLHHGNPRMLFHRMAVGRLMGK